MGQPFHYNEKIDESSTSYQNTKIDEENFVHPEIRDENNSPIENHIFCR